MVAGRYHELLAGIGESVDDPVSVHLHRVARALAYRAGDFQAVAEAAEEIPSLPTFLGITAAWQKQVAAAWRDAP